MTNIIIPSNVNILQVTTGYYLPSSLLAYMNARIPSSYAPQAVRKINF